MLFWSDGVLSERLQSATGNAGLGSEVSWTEKSMPLPHS